MGAMGRMNLGIAIDLDDVVPVAVCDLWPPHRYGRLTDMTVEPLWERTNGLGEVFRRGTR